MGEYVNDFLSLIFRAISVESFQKLFQKQALLELKESVCFQITGKDKNKTKLNKIAYITDDLKVVMK